MGFRFRRTLKIIPGVRLNFSLGGPSVSLGPRGLHYTVGMRGTRITAGIPGSGLFWTKFQSYAPSSPSPSEQPSQPPTAMPDGRGNDLSPHNAQIFESSSIEDLVAGSTSELAPMLNAARRQIRIHIVVLVLLFAVLVAELAINASPPIIATTVIFGIVAWPLAALFDQYRLTMTLEYSLQDSQSESFSRLTTAFTKLMECRSIWKVPAEWKEDDWKRHAGASATVQRKQVHLRIGTPRLIKSNVAFLCIPLGNKDLYFAPDSILIVSGRSVAALHYDDVEMIEEATTFIEDQEAPDDAQVVGETWQYVNRNGTPDRRFANNRKRPICRYGQMDFRSSGGLNERLNYSRLGAAKDFVACATTMRHSIGAEPVKSSVSTVKDPAKPIADNPKDQIGGDIALAFANESDKARSLALHHGKYWEFLLVEDLLKSKLQVLKNEYNKFEETLTSLEKRQFSIADFMDWLHDRSKSLGTAILKMTNCIQVELPDAMGKPGVSGDARRILGAVDAFFGCCQSFLAFELDVCAAGLPANRPVFRDDFRGITSWVIGVAERLTDDWGRAVEEVRKGSHDFNVKLELHSPPQFERALADIEKINKNPEMYK
jgi:hypothetical protein